MDDYKSGHADHIQTETYEPPKVTFVPLKLQERLFGTTAYSEHGGSC